MKKFIFLLILLFEYTCAQNCFNCAQGACNANGCQQCADGYMLSSQGWCGLFTPIEGCRIYDYLYTNRCTQCNPDRMLIQSRCYIKPQNCLVSDKNRQCLSCQSGFSLWRGNCYTQQIQNCPAGALPGSGFCQPLRAQNCQRTSGDDKICDSCNAGYTLINGRCLRVTSNTTCPSSSCQCNNGFIYGQTCYNIQIDQCNIYRDPVYCSACSVGFIAIGGICLVPIKQDDINCNVLAPLSDYCTGCNQNYFLNADAFCQRNFNLTSCPTSTNLFHLFNGICFYNDPRCDEIDTVNQTYRCLWCQEGFSLVNGICQRNICIQFSQTRNCQQAFIGYSIVGVNQYIKLPANCLQVFPGSSICAQCSNYTRNVSMIIGQSGNFVCAYYDQNCVQYNSNGSCIQCVNQSDYDGYILKNRFCFKKAENCAIRNPNDFSLCSQCNSGYHLDATDSKCYVNVVGCEVYLTGSDCRQCVAQTYVLYNKKCYASNSQCIDYDTNNVCRRCSQGLMPFQNICVYYHPHCLQYGPDKVCSQAASGWSLGNGMTETQKQYYRAFMLAGQQVSSSSNAVSTNGLGSGAGAGAYSLGGFITAFPYANLVSSKIASVNMLGQIVACNQGYTLINQACIQKITPNCNQYTLDQICIQCQPQYTLMSDFTCASGLQCATPQDVSNGRCLRCASGYILIGVQCFYIGSKTTIDQWLTSSSFFKITFSDGTYMAWPRMANCLSQNNPLVCNQCASPFQNIQGYCVMLVDKCSDYGFSSGVAPGLCQSCQAGSILWLGQCRRLTCTQVNNGLCVSCPAGYYYYFGVCLSNAQPNCRIYENGVCQLCNYGYYVNSLGQCQQQVNQCLVTNPDTGRCLECRSSMTLYRQKCVYAINYCIDYDSNNRCINCQQNTINRTQLMNDGTCALLQGQCAAVDQTTKVCATCNLGYTLIQQNGIMLCVNQKANCANYDTFGRCTACSGRFVLQNNQCKLYIQYCLAYTPDQQNCLTCASGTTLDNGCCRISVPNCQSFTFCQCTTCQSGYFLTSNGMCEINPDGCQVFDYTNNKCTQCAVNYYMMPNGICLSVTNVINGCQQGFNLTYTQSVGFQCVKCIDGFILNTTDNLCYGYNCLTLAPATRNCLTCPLYYKTYKANSSDLLTYCIPYFCDEYIPGQSVCIRYSTFYTGGHTIITVNTTITIVYCLSIDSNNGKCGQCTNYRYPSPNTQYNLCYPFHCKNTSEFMCSQCEIGYGPDSKYPGSCVAQFCSKFKFDGSCEACIMPYTLSAGICINTGCCETYDNVANVCTAAKKYYALQNNVCTANNCAKLDPNKISICLECMLGYKLFSDGTCRVSNCQQETFSGDSCIECNPGFNLQFGNSSKAICVPRYCSSISQDLSYCLQCPEGFTLNANRLCQADLCATYLNSLVCQTCISYYIVNQNGRCVADCQVGNITRCQCCKYGYSLNSTSGLCQPSSSYCISSSSNSCQRCVTGYNLVSGQCIAPVLNCKTPSIFGCLACNPGYEVVNNCQCLPANCLQQKADGSCAQCHPRFELTAEGLCKPRDCQFFSAQSWSCNGCYSRFTFVNGMCITTDCSVWTDFQNTTCKVCNTTTIYVNGQLITYSYDLVNGSCYIRFCQNNPRNIYCTQCVPGYSLTSNGLCQCTSVGANNTCICPTNYVFDANKGCIINLDPCLARDQSGNCLQCPYQYILSNGQCVALYCAKWEFPSPRYAVCLSCYPNFILKDGFCVSTLCTKFVNQTGFLFPQCSACPIGYTPFSNFCIPTYCDSNTYDLVKGLCMNCTQPGFVLSADSTRCVLANCEDFTFPNTCSRCKNGYDFVSGICQARNCSTLNGYTCIACAPGFYLNNSLCYANACAQWNTNLLCVKCNDGFLLAPNLTCVRMYCNIDSKDKCIQCIRGYSFNTNLQRCVPSNCQKYFPNYDGCDTCLQGYYKENGTCLDIYCDPSSFNIAFICQKCPTGYSFNSNGLCYPTNPGFCPPGQYFNITVGACVNIDINYCQILVNNVCMWCAPGYFLYRNLCYSFQYCSSYSYFYGCYQCIPGYVLEGFQCVKYSQDPNCLQSSSTQCLLCKTGYKLLNGKCIFLPQYCQDVNINGNCISCIAGYVLNNGLCQVSDQNCLSFNTQGKCTQCRTGFYLNLQGICQTNPRNCTSANSAGLCLQCIQGFTLQNGICYKEYPFCALYSESTTFCSQCIQNFTLTGIQCKCASGSQLILNQFCIKLPPNCLIINQTTFVCASCINGFVLTFDFTCVKNITIPANCSIYDPLTGICKQCLPNFILSNNVCIACSAGQVKVGNLCFPVITGCLQYLDNGQCKQCMSGYRLSDGTCLTINPPMFCSIYDPATGICQKCIDNYVPTSNGLECKLVNCLNASADGRSCLACIPGYILTYGLCVKQIQIQFCDSYNLTTGICVRCASGYAPTADGKLCILINCQQMDPTGLSCVTCISPFQWNGQWCVFITDFCSAYNNGYCSNCLYSTSLQKNRCVPNYCSNYNYDSGFCLTCLSGYTLYNKLCYLIIQYCIAYGQTGLCTQCQSGYNLANGGAICQQAFVPIPSCFSQSSSSNVCNRCMHRYYESSQMCSTYLPYCINIDPLGRCISCCFGSTLNNGTCTRDTTIKFCAQQVGSTCKQCLPNYSYCSFCQACLPVTPNCASYSSNGVCLQCIENFYLVNGVCISLPVGYVTGAFGTCRSGYYQSGQNCYRNAADLRLYSSTATTTTTTTSTTYIQGSTTLASSSSSSTSTTSTSSPTSSSAYVIKTKTNPLIIFSIVINTLKGSLPNNASFILYYRSKVNDPYVCWNSCIPTKIDQLNYSKDLVYPIIAAQVNVYLINHQFQNVGIDFKLLQ